MARQSTTADALAKISAIRNAPEQFDLKRDLAPFLHHKSNHVVAAAANIVKRFEVSTLTPDLIGAFLELFPKGAERDQGCKAMIAIVEALVTTGEEASEVYLAGIHYIQMEGSFGPPIDAAAPLRGLCARGLVRMRHPDALYQTVGILADREVAARSGAVAALGDANSREAELLLRLKVLLGDRESEVIGECFRSLLSIDARRSLEFVASYLKTGSEEVIEAAALALGEARLQEALNPLQAAWEKHRQPALRRTLLLSIAMLRTPEAVDFLLTRLKQDPDLTAEHALEALAIYQNDEAIRARAKETVERRNLPRLSQAFAKSWR